MLRYYNVDVVFSEVPSEVTLAVNITGCPNRCPGCHSPLMQEDVGLELTHDEMSSILGRYGRGITCVCFMGGDADCERVLSLARQVRQECPGVKTAWYSGCSRDVGDDSFADSVCGVLDYIKVGPYIEERGPLTCRTTNQRFYLVGADRKFTDITYRFYDDGRK